MLYSYARLQMLLLFINVPCFVAQYLVSFLVLQLFCEEKRAGCLTLFVFLVSRGCYCTVSLPCSAMGWSAVFACGIS